MKPCRGGRAGEEVREQGVACDEVGLQSALCGADKGARLTWLQVDSGDSENMSAAAWMPGPVTGSTQPWLRFSQQLCSAAPRL
jgi:hypothetical protein